MKNASRPSDLSTEIARDIRQAIVGGDLAFDQRLPSETELAEHFGVSRPTVREALKRLAAQSLIRTARGATGGAFVNRLTFEDAYPQQITTSTLLLTMNAVSFDTACEARFALERACTPYAAKRRKESHLATMHLELVRQGQIDVSDEAFCASDVTFHRALVDAANNPILSYQLAGAVEGMQPLMNMITFSARDRSYIVELHKVIVRALETRNSDQADGALYELERYTRNIAQADFEKRRAQEAASTPDISVERAVGDF